ncbi:MULTISPECIES: hypothetical protein [Okeania]|uniref:Uncharacterized protein n=1 Tax=Okeania hirsuta TaxID=1458930 RepID=A0A3N6Q4I1_9CYAN|nr:MULTISPECIES: hypothetical protein [Okeania]NES79819.1 hypothetical protein [Okeania sp. SIO1H4]NES88151.1 hypothetical protein [Okeania sp. SIO2B9]NET23507.1 hypothetical protein [Okeania sp. SIO1H5]NET97286.1 hypothetical protein [Okeania sp. SIO1H2]RQH23091.1 hypothetical protein D4Z78_06940 [Okeania hirsuta]
MWQATFLFQGIFTAAILVGYEAVGWWRFLIPIIVLKLLATIGLTGYYWIKRGVSDFWELIAFTVLTATAFLSGFSLGVFI